MVEKSNQELLDALGVDTASVKKAKLTPKQERIIAGFEEIQRFVEQHGHIPQHGEDKDIFERLYATRLEQIRGQDECRDLVVELDHQGLLSEEDEKSLEALDDKALLAELGLSDPQQGDITFLQYVKPRAETRVVDEVANRVTCKDFETFKPLFNVVQEELDSGLRETLPFKGYAEILEGDWFILSGQKVYVAELGKTFIAEHGRSDARLRAIYDNGTESDLLMRSLQRALNKDKTGRRIVDITRQGPLFDDVTEEGDLASGSIYVLRSKANHPVIEKNRNIIHKIGITGGDIKQRIANAKLDPTFLMADVEVIRTYDLFNINRVKLENLIHRFFSDVRLEIEIPDRMGNMIAPREWFLVPEFIIDEVVEKITQGTLSDYYYDIEGASLQLFHASS